MLVHIPAAGGCLALFSMNSEVREPKIVTAGRRHGPYHHARFAAAAMRCDLTAVEFSRRDKVNLWDYVSEARGFHQVSLFTDDVDIDDRPPAEIKRMVQRALDDINPAAVAVPGWSHYGALACLQWCLCRRRAAVLMSESTAHDEPRVWWQEAVKRRVVPLFGAALVGGTAHRAYTRSLGLPDEAIFEGYDAVDNAYFAEGAAHAHGSAAALHAAHRLPRRFFLASSRFVEKKNLIRLLNAYALYRRGTGGASWSLVLLGDGELRPMIEHNICRLELGEHVFLPGFKQHNELPTYYGLASAFIHPSTSEQWGLVVNEAMASGLPVLVSERCGCAPDLVRNGVNGYGFDPYDIGRLSELMAQIASLTDEPRLAMGRASQRIISAWGLDRFVDGLMKAIEVAVQHLPRRVGWLDSLTLEGLMRR
jgi:1,2-diacylglycerol 3-alpha-glucosyltransferase